jgi:hypothetical protein
MIPILAVVAALGWGWGTLQRHQANKARAGGLRILRMAAVNEGRLAKDVRQLTARVHELDAETDRLREIIATSIDVAHSALAKRAHLRLVQ